MQWDYLYGALKFYESFMYDFIALKNYPLEVMALFICYPHIGGIINL